MNTVRIMLSLSECVLKTISMGKLGLGSERILHNTKTGQVIR
jgi:hypothetical protein